MNKIELVKNQIRLKLFLQKEKEIGIKRLSKELEIALKNNPFKGSDARSVQGQELK